MKIAKPALLSAMFAATLASTAVQAQEAPQKPAMPEAAAQAAQTMDVSDGQVAEFADAYVAVQSLSKQYGAQVQQVTDPEEKQSLQKQTQGQIQSAIKDSGLSLDEYKNIARAANANEELRERISVAVNDIVQPELNEESGS
ncbi:DUF4168 domain-containing protein [Gilvimarinus sp. 1_MG-2023]|uniref:DUF4168 domain-containing protein n=1 Tax=Gilvimarinus sp. 1_MG-2023 TaxID=3062638 RepID=UPI0026E48A8C|nr:DUF4168 domain-containing protein [Gilvimarinus sp. 1_MG-2023]MDO6746568.1 DUF4168 domain-containing protein [Gilvimarinus sp. 1_MG-2023]